MKKLILLVLIIVAVWAGAWVLSKNKPEQLKAPNDQVNLSPSDAEILANSIRTFKEDAEKRKDIIVIETPEPGDLVESPLIIKGKARGWWFFEGSFPLELLMGPIRVESYATAQGEWMTEEFVPFTATLYFEVPPNQTLGQLILKKDNPSGLPENDDSLSLPVRLSPTEQPEAETMSVKVYLNKPILAAESCDEIQNAVTRVIPKTEGIARAVILELLKGPTAADLADSLTTSIPSGVILNKIEVTNGTAYADFDAGLERNAGGSCSAIAIRAQIEDTLKQFSTIKNVVISVEGRTEDILQP
ncbi:MAG: GerMN domain-containing protein [Minisyncoccia bacterium]